MVANIKLNSITLRIVLPLVLMLSAGLGCKTTAPGNNSKIVKSTDQKYQITVPKDWSPKNPEKDEVIRVIDDSTGAVVLVSEEKKMDMADDMTLGKYSDQGRSQLLEKHVATDATDAESITVNGAQARQYEANMVKNNGKVTCLITTIEGSDRFFRIFGCAVPSKYDKAALKQVTETFRQTSESESKSTPSQ